MLDVQSVHPGAVSTNMNNFKKVTDEVVIPEEVARGSLSDLGTNVLNVFGAMKHTCIGRAITLVAWSPHVNKAIGNDISKDKDVVM